MRSVLAIRSVRMAGIVVNNPRVSHDGTLDVPDIDAEAGKREPDKHERRLPVERISSGLLLGRT